MTQRQQIIAFARMNGLSVLPNAKGVVTLFKAAPNPLNDWADHFDNWAQAHEFLLATVVAVRDGAATQYPWSKAG